MIDPARIDALIGQVYDAAVSPDLWNGLAPRIAESLGASSTVMQLRNLSRGSVTFLDRTANLEQPMMTDYQVHYWQYDLWANFAKPGQIVTSGDVMPDDQFERTEFYCDWVRKADIFYLIGTLIQISTDIIGVLGVHRGRHHGAFDEQDRNPFRSVTMHLQRALQLQHRLSVSGIAGRAAIDALERSGLATLVVMATGHILYTNRMAEKLLRQTDGLRCIGGRLSATRSQQQLATLIRDAALTAAGRQMQARLSPSGGMLALPRDGRLPLTVMVAPFRPARDGFGMLQPAAILFIRDPETASPAIPALQGLFGLTPTEAAVAAALATGQTPDQIAAQLGIGISTVRSHLKATLAKTGTGRQAELVALLLRSVAVMDGG